MVSDDNSIILSNLHKKLCCGCSLAGAQFEGDLGEILALGAEISPFIGLREKCESPLKKKIFFFFFFFLSFHLFSTP